MTTPTPQTPEKPKSLLDQAKADITKKKKTPAKKKKKAPAKKPASPKNPRMLISNIVFPKTWNREKLGDISDLKASMRARGQLQPVAVRKVPGLSKGKVELVAGRRRIAAAKELKWTEIEYTYASAETEGDAYLDSLLENEVRRANTPHERVLAYHKLSTEFSMTNEQIAKACGKTAGQVSQHLAVIKAPKKAQIALKNGKVALHLFRYLSKLDYLDEKDKILYDKMLDAAIAGTMQTSAIAEKIEAHVEKKREKAATSAKKSGKKAPTAAPKKGAAAHKRKKAPGPVLTDYQAKDTKRHYKLKSLQENIKYAEFNGKKMENASKKEKRAYYQGCIDGAEHAIGLVEIDLD